MRILSLFELFLVVFTHYAISETSQRLSLNMAKSLI